MTTTNRYFRTTGTAAQVAAYMPTNYRVDFVGTDGKVYGYGYDDAGWTLDGYVMPRLGSGLYVAEEVDGEVYGAAYAAVTVLPHTDECDLVGFDDDDEVEVCSLCAGSGCQACGGSGSAVVEVEDALDAFADVPEAPECAGCGGNEFVLLGTLGRVQHARCRACGLDAAMGGE